MKPAFPHGEDPGGIAGGDTDAKLRPMAHPIPFASGPPMGAPPGAPPGENRDWTGGTTVARASFRGGAFDPATGAGGDSERFRQPGTDDDDDQIENRAVTVGLPKDEDEEDQREYPVDFLVELRNAESQAEAYMAQANRRQWVDALKAFHEEHSTTSPYRSPEFRNRTRFFRAKTKSAARKDYAAVAASLFNNVDSITCFPGNASDPRQKAAAGLMQELVNYRTTRTSQRAAIPWFLVSMGARLDAYLMGICISKQYWKVEYKHSHVQRDETTGEETDVYTTTINRPEVAGVPPENVIIYPACDWTNPAQTAQYFIIKWPMTLDQIKEKQNSPVKPWKKIEESLLKGGSADAGTADSMSVRRSREQGLDRMSEQAGYGEFQIIWVYETYMRAGGEDWTFFSLADKALFTDPAPVEEVYPEQFGDRPISFGYGSLEPHRVFPQSIASSLQQYQRELNELANLGLDALKQHIMPTPKIKRGGQVDLDQVKKRGHGTAIMVNDPTDVTWDAIPELPQSLPIMQRSLELEMDDLAGQFNGQTAQDNNALSRTLGGLKLVAGAANAVQEFDIRLWLETWCEPVLAQVMHLEQFYEDDKKILALCGQKAKLFPKYGINKIDDELMSQEVALRVSAGLGAGDPQQRLTKFAAAAQITTPIIAASPEFQRGDFEANLQAIIDEVWGAAGYKDAFERFFKPGEGKQDPLGDLPAQKLQSEIEKNKQTGKASVMNALANLGKAAIGKRALEDEIADRMMERLRSNIDMGHQHADMIRSHILEALRAGHEHGHALAQHHHARQLDWAGHDRGIAQDEQGAADAAADREAAAAQAAARASANGGSPAGGGNGAAAAAPAPEPEPAEAPPEEEAAAAAPQAPQIPIELLRPIRYHLVKDQAGKTVDIIPIYADQVGQQPAGPQPPMGPQPPGMQPPPWGGQ